MSEGKVVDRTRASQLLSARVANDPVVHARLGSSGVDPIVVRVSVEGSEQARGQNGRVVGSVFTSLEDRDRDGRDFCQACREREACCAAAADDLRSQS